MKEADKEKQNKQDEAKGIDVKLEGENRGTKTMRQRKQIKNTDEPSAINDDFGIDQNSDNINARQE
jgi:hypothetical protein